MATNTPAKENKAALSRRLKSLKMIIIALSTLMLLYLGFFIYQLSNGTWQASDRLGSSIVGGLVLMLVACSALYTSTAQRLKKIGGL